MSKALLWALGDLFYGSIAVLSSPDLMFLNCRCSLGSGAILSKRHGPKPAVHVAVGRPLAFASAWTIDVIDACQFSPTLARVRVIKPV
jgi:hypothetical protein